MGKSIEAVQNLYLAFGIYKQLTKPEFEDANAALDAAHTLVLIAKVSRQGSDDAFYMIHTPIQMLSLSLSCAHREGLSLYICICKDEERG